MKTIKFYFLTVTFVLLANSCNNPFNHHDLSPAGKLPAGKGSLSLKIAGNERTIMPKPFANKDLYYELIFTPAGAGNEQTINCNYDELNEPVVLDVGKYSLVVNAYGDEDHNQLLFYGTKEGISITAGDNPPVTITLESIDLSVGAGTFSWDITFSADVISASMDIKQRNSGTLEESITLVEDDSDNLPTNAVGTFKLPSGFYDVLITMTGDNPDYGAVTVTRKEILHIYNGYESTYTKAFTDDYFSNTISSVGISLQWEEKAGKITVSGSDGVITISKSGTNSFTAQYNGVGTVRWYVWGLIGSGSSIIINAADYNTGTYQLVAEVTIDDVPYSAEISFIVAD